jgi:hypothetical protein
MVLTLSKRNVKVSEAPSFGESIINYDATSKGNKLFAFSSVIRKTVNSFMAKAIKNKPREEIICIIKDPENDIKS